MMTDYAKVLRQKFDEHELAQIRELEKRIHELKENVDSLSESDLEQGFRKLAVQRLLGSNSLKRGEVAQWARANEQVQTKVNQNLYPQWPDLCEINALLTFKQPKEVIRTEEIYVGPYAACSIAELPTLLDFFKAKILVPQPQGSLLVHAALCQYWLVSLHPFHDGNGRTAVMLADWLLTMNDYLPQSFTGKADGIVMFQPGRPTVLTPGRAVLRILKNILNSYLCF